MGLAPQNGILPVILLGALFACLFLASFASVIAWVVSMVWG